MLDLITLSDNFTTFPWVYNYICFMRIAVQVIVANYGLTLIRAIIYKLKLPTVIYMDGFWDIADRAARVACLLIMLLIHLTPYCVRIFMV